VRPHVCSVLHAPAVNIYTAATEFTGYSDVNAVINHELFPNS
jgi:hypothetical protein